MNSTFEIVFNDSIRMMIGPVEIDKTESITVSESGEEGRTWTDWQQLRAAWSPIVAWITMVLVGTFMKVHPFSSLSLVTSVRELISRRDSRLNMLDVFRVMAIVWVMINHTGSEGRVDILERKSSAIAFKTAVHDHPVFGPLLGNSALGVEIFLVLSGLLAARSWLSSITAKDASFCHHFVQFIFRRWLRLIPSLAVFVYLAIGPITEAFLPRYHATMISSCGVSGVASHLGFVGNWQSTPTCLGYLWYLGLDMQLYVVAPFFLVVISKRPKLGCLLAAGVLAISAALRAGYCRSYGVCNKSDVDIPDPASIAPIYAGLWEMYARPYTKCGPFVLGLVLGYATVYLRCEMSARVARGLFWSSSLLATLVIYGILPEYWNPNQGDTIYNTLYTALFRSVFAAAICGIIAAGFYGTKKVSVGIVWSILARLTFTAYLVHMPVVYIFNHVAFLQSAQGPYELLAIVPLVGSLSFLAAFVFYVFVESPIARVFAEIFKST